MSPNPLPSGTRAPSCGSSSSAAADAGERSWPVRFVHLTFQEYLAASAIAHGEAPFEQVRPHLHDPWWREVILLAGGETQPPAQLRVKADTTAWLTGIREAHTWAERFLFRDLQLAAHSCAEMTETGVDPTVTEEIARQLIEAVFLYDYRFPAPPFPFSSGNFPFAISPVRSLPRSPLRRIGRNRAGEFQPWSSRAYCPRQ
jgi:hypothetical protein